MSHILLKFINSIIRKLDEMVETTVWNLINIWHWDKILYFVLINLLHYWFERFPLLQVTSNK